MKKSIIEVIKTNRKAIVKRVVVVGGSILALAVAIYIATPNDDEFESNEDEEVVEETEDKVENQEESSEE